MARRAVLVVVALLAPFMGGCASWVARGGLKEPYAPYNGVRLDAAAIVCGIESVVGANDADAETRIFAVMLSLLAVFDLPFSAIADTFRLPQALSNQR